MSKPSAACPAAAPLRARALRLLTQREHSRSELRDKLLRQAVVAEDDQAREAVLATVEAVLDWLEAEDFLSERRFVEARVHLRAPRFGVNRIRQELARRGVQMDEAAAQQLHATELQRAQAAWLRKFKTPACDAAARARQMRFLAGRGFSPEVIRQVVRGEGNDAEG